MTNISSNNKTNDLKKYSNLNNNNGNWWHITEGQSKEIEEYNLQTDIIELEVISNEEKYAELHNMKDVLNSILAGLDQEKAKWEAEKIKQIGIKNRANTMKHRGNGLVNKEELEQEKLEAQKKIEEADKKIKEIEEQKSLINSNLYAIEQEIKIEPYAKLTDTQDYKDFIENYKCDYQDFDYGIIDPDDGNGNGLPLVIPEMVNQNKNFDKLAILEYMLQCGYTYEELEHFEPEFGDFLKYNKYMTEEQRNMYHYLISTKGKEEADKYLTVIEDSVNKAYGSAMANEFILSLDFEDEMKLKDNLANLFGVSIRGLGDGIGTFAEGIENAFKNNKVLSAEEYKKMIILQYLTENSNILDETYQFNSALGNMLPAITASAVATFFATPVAGKVVGNALMGLSSFGNAKHEGLVNGNDLATSTLYGLFVGGSEVTLGYFLGKIPGLSETSGLTFKNLLSEGAEEYLQTYIQAGCQAIILGKDVNWDEIPEEAMASFMMGFLMSGFLNGGQSVVETVINGKTCKIDIEKTLAYMKEHPDVSIIEAMEKVNGIKIDSKQNSETMVEVNDIRVDNNQTIETITMSDEEMNALKNLKMFFENDLKIKNIFHDIAPKEEYRYNKDSCIEYGDKLYRAIEDIEFYTTKIVSNFFENDVQMCKDFFANIKSELLKQGFDYNKLSDFYSKYISHMSEEFVEEVGTNYHGYPGYDYLPSIEFVSTNELLHLIHHLIVNNEDILQSMPKLNTKNNDFGYPITLYGISSDLSKQIFEQFPLELDCGWTDIITLNNKIIMMVRDRGHALSIEIEKGSNDKYYIRYFIPKICNVDMVNNLKGVKKVDNNSQYTVGIIETTETNLPSELFEFISKVPTDDDMFSIGGPFYESENNTLSNNNDFINDVEIIDFEQNSENNGQNTKIDTILNEMSDKYNKESFEANPLLVFDAEFEQKIKEVTSLISSSENVTDEQLKNYNILIDNRNVAIKNIISNSIDVGAENYVKIIEIVDLTNPKNMEYIMLYLSQYMYSVDPKILSKIEFAMNKLDNLVDSNDESVYSNIDNSDGVPNIVDGILMFSENFEERIKQLSNFFGDAGEYINYLYTNDFLSTEEIFYALNETEKKDFTEFLQNTYQGQFLSKLTPEELKVLIMYTSKYYDEINNTLRGKFNADNINNIDFKTIITNIDNAIKKYGGLNADMYLYRAVKTSAFVSKYSPFAPLFEGIDTSDLTQMYCVLKCLEGEDIADLGYMSTSATYNGSFAVKEDYPIVYKILAKEGCEAAYINQISKMYNTENEVLLSRNSGLKIVNVLEPQKDINGIEKIIIECVLN